MAALGSIGSKLPGARLHYQKGKGVNRFRPSYTDGTKEQTTALYDHTLGLTSSGVVEAGLGVPGAGGGITVY